MRILLLNGNTTVAVTAALAMAAREVALPGTEIVPATAEFGAPVIGNRTENAIATYAILALAAERTEGCDGAIIGVSWDTGLYPIRELLQIPVVGMSEAAMLTACTLGDRFGVVVVGGVGIAATRELLALYGLAGRCAGIAALKCDAAAVLADPAAAAAGIIELSEELIGSDAADVIVLAGAVMAGMPHLVQPALPVPVVEGIRSAVPLVEGLARAAYPKPSRGSFAAVAGRKISSVTPGLTRLLGRGDPAS